MSSFFIISVILVIVLCSHILLNLQIQLLVQRLLFFRVKYRINFTTSTRSTTMSSIRVTVDTEDQIVSINNLFSLLSARSGLSFVEGFDLVEITEMIDYVSTS